MSSASTIELKHSPQRWYLAALLTTGMIFCYAHRSALGVAAPFMIKDLGLNSAVMGILLSAFFWSYALMQVPAGWLVDRFGVRRSYAVGFLFWSLASAATGMAGSLVGVASLRMAVGVGQSVSFPASARAVANWFQESERGFVSALYLTGVRVGAALVGALGVYVSRSNWKLFFLLTGLVPLIWLFPWMRFLKGWDDRRLGTASSARSAESFLSSLSLLKQRTVLGIFLGFFAYDYAWYVYLTWLPGYLVIERGFTAREMGIYSSVPYLVMSVIIMLSGVLSDWMVRRGAPEIRVRKSFVIVGLLIGCLIIPAGMVEEKMTAIWLLTVSLCGLGICSPNTWTLTQAVSAKNVVGTVSGIQNFGGNLGGILAPALTGFIAHATHSFALALGLTGAVLIAGVFAYWLLISEQIRSVDEDTLTTTKKSE